MHVYIFKRNAKQLVIEFNVLICLFKAGMPGAFSFIPTLPPNADNRAYYDYQSMSLQANVNALNGAQAGRHQDSYALPPFNGREQQLIQRNTLQPFVGV